MKNKNGYTLIELLVLIVVLGVVVFVVISKTTYAFKDNSSELYQNDIQLILHQAREYGNSVETIAEDKEIIVTVSELIEKGYLVAEDNNFLSSTGENLNDLKIKISYNEEEENCDAVLLN